MEFYKLLPYNFNKISKIFTLKKQVKQIFIIIILTTSINLFFTFIIHHKINKIIDKLNKKNNNEDIEDK
jgi:hypothetical protein